MHRPTLLAVLLSCLAALASPDAAAVRPPKTVTVASPRLALGDVVAGIGADLATLDLGPAPAAGATRLFTRGDLQAAVGDRAAGVRLPEAVRVERRTRRLSPQDLEAMVRASLEGKLPRGAALSAVRARGTTVVADGWDVVAAALPRLPRKVGRLATSVQLELSQQGTVIAGLQVPVELTLSAEAALPDVAKGAPVTVVVRRGFVEIQAQAVAGADADVGDALPVLLRGSGRSLRALLVTADRAELVEGHDGARPRASANEGQP